MAVDAQGRAYVGGMVAPQGAQFGPLAIGARAGSTGFVAQLGGLPTATRSAGLAGAATLFPVPVRAGGAVTLRYELGARATVQAQVRDILGRLVLGGAPQQQPAGAQQLVLETGDLAPGRYGVHLLLDGQHMVRPLLVE